MHPAHTVGDTIVMVATTMLVMIVLLAGGVLAGIALIRRFGASTRGGSSSD